MRSFPSIARFSTSFLPAWASIAIYLKWTGFVDLTLFQIFLPMYILLAISILFFWHRIGTLGLLEAIPQFLFLISLGVLHAALADPNNNHYNALAVVAPWLPILLVGLIFGIAMSVGVFCGEDQNCCDVHLEEVLIFTIGSVCTAVVYLWFTFLILLLQHLIRPNSGWWVPPYFAVHFLTYVIIIFIGVIMWTGESLGVGREARVLGHDDELLPENITTKNTVLNEHYFRGVGVDGVLNIEMREAEDARLRLNAAMLEQQRIHVNQQHDRNDRNNRAIGGNNNDDDDGGGGGDDEINRENTENNNILRNQPPNRRNRPRPDQNQNNHNNILDNNVVNNPNPAPESDNPNYNRDFYYLLLNDIQEIGDHGEHLNGPPIFARDYDDTAPRS
jgi:hypothetical protein